jgi:hypothetical protein
LSFVACAVACEVLVWDTEPVSPGLLLRMTIFALSGAVCVDAAVAVLP